MQERVRGTIAVVVVWVLLGALAAGAALTVNSNGTPGDELAGGGRPVGTLEESLQGFTLAAGGGRAVGSLEESLQWITLAAGGGRVPGTMEE